MLSANAITGRNSPMPEEKLPFSDAPQSLQYDAPSTTIGRPHREQKSGAEDWASGTEGERRLAQPDQVAVLERRFGHALPANEGAVLAAEIAQAKAAVTRVDSRMIARD